MILKLEYIWIDGNIPWNMRSKIKVVEREDRNLSINDIDKWSFDGSSTNQAYETDSDCILSPVYLCKDPTYQADFLVLCEVLNKDMTSHKTNKRSDLEKLIYKNNLSEHEVWVGFEQEYTIMKNNRPLGFPESGYPEPQGMYYCSAGGSKSFGREISVKHLNMCIKAGLNISGTNAEVLPGQWEIQVGGVNSNPIVTSDELWISRWLLLKISEEYGYDISFDPKPVSGDWNGSGCHTNISTKKMRENNGLEEIYCACEKLSKNVDKCLKLFGNNIESRLTGKNETCSYKDFKYGISDRTASIRIPTETYFLKKGYLEDRRPNANCNPYEVCYALIESILL